MMVDDDKQKEQTNQTSDIDASDETPTPDKSKITIAESPMPTGKILHG